MFVLPPKVPDDLISKPATSPDKASNILVALTSEMSSPSTVWVAYPKLLLVVVKPNAVVTITSSSWLPSARDTL